MLREPINIDKNDGGKFTKVNTKLHSCKLHL